MPRRSLIAMVMALFAVGLVASAGPALAGGGCHGPDGTDYTEGPATVVRMDVCAFVPTVVRVPVGTTIRFLNSAPNQHAVTGRSQTWGSATLDPGADFSERFGTAGIYPYACPLHPGMVGAVIVGDPPAAGPAGAVVSANDPAPVTPPDSGAPSQPDATPIAAGAVVGLVGGAVIALLGAGLLAGRRRSTPAGRAVVD